MPLAAPPAVQVEYHYFHQTNITVPREMLAVLQGLQARDLRVFHVVGVSWLPTAAAHMVRHELNLGLPRRSPTTGGKITPKNLWSTPTFRCAGKAGNCTPCTWCYCCMP